MLGGVKCLKVPHQWGEIGQRVGQLQMVWLFLSAMVLFSCKEIASNLMAKMLHTYFQNSVIHSYKVMGDKTLHPGISPKPTGVDFSN